MFDLPVASMRIYACRDTLAAGLATRFSVMLDDQAGSQIHGEPGDYSITFDGADLPQGVSVRVLTPLPVMMAEIPGRSIDELHDRAVMSAWSCGAWDIALDYLPPLQGPELGLVASNIDYSACSDLNPILIEAAERGRLAMWLWKPMRGGPANRRKMHGMSDITLDAQGGRAGPVPAAIRRPALDWQGYRNWGIRLGKAHAGDTGKRPRPATINQRGYLGRLLRLSGKSDRLPGNLSFDRASAWIDEIKGGSADVP